MFLSVQFRLLAVSDSLRPQALLSITNSWSPPKLMSIESVMPSNHLILCCPLLLLPSIFPSIRVFSNESALCIRGAVNSILLIHPFPAVNSILLIHPFPTPSVTRILFSVSLGLGLCSYRYCTCIIYMYIHLHIKDCQCHLYCIVMYPVSSTHTLAHTHTHIHTHTVYKLTHLKRP